MDSRVSVPLLSPFTIYLEWKLNMISYLKRQGIYEISIGVGEESYEEKSDWLTDYDRAYGIMCLVMSPKMHYLIDFVEYAFDLWNNLDKYFGV